MSRRRLLCFGMGYTASALARRLGPEWSIVGTTRYGDGDTRQFDREHKLPSAAFDGITDILVSIAPDHAGDPVLDQHGEDIAALRGLRWVGYLSTTGVYGTRDGGWVDEESALRPTSERSVRRVAAEARWLDLCRQHGVPVHVFRLSGIYGPGRSAFDGLREGLAKRLYKPGHVFSRIHVDDLASVLLASICKPRPGAIYNVCDDEPAASADVVAYAANLLGIDPLPLVPFDTVKLSPLALSFWADDRRVSNALIKRELGVRIAYPNYRVGLAAILAEIG
jgi:nucleoside-diphosphate-sugar epimerase